MIKRLIAGLLVCSMSFSLFIPSYASASSNDQSESVNNAPVENIETPLEDIQPESRIAFVIPAIIGTAELGGALTAGLTAAVGFGMKALEKDNAGDSVQLSTKKEIEKAANEIPNKLKKEGDPYSVDTSKFNQKVKGSSELKDPKTGWSIEKSNTNHKGDSWKVQNKKGKRVASITEDGRIVGK